MIFLYDLKCTFFLPVIIHIFSVWAVVPFLTMEFANYLYVFLENKAQNGFNVSP